MDLQETQKQSIHMNPESIGKLVQYWVYYNNKIKELNNETRRLRATEAAYEQQILQLLKSSNMMNPVIQIGDGRIIIGEDKNQQPLSYSMLETTLTNYYAGKPGSKNETQDILKFIRQQRSVKSTPCLKRVSNSTSRKNNNEKKV
jgi:hypothetical protein